MSGHERRKGNTMATSEPLERQLYSAREVELLTGMSHSAVWRAARRGNLPVVRIGNRFYFPKQAIDRMLHGTKIEATDARLRVMTSAAKEDQP